MSIRLSLSSKCVWLTLSLVALATNTLTAQIASPSLTVQYLNDQPQVITLDEIKKLPSSQLKIKDRDGQEVTYAGVYLHEFLELTEAPIGESLRGAAMGMFIMAEAKDGYRVLFSLPEVDPAFGDRRVLLAYAKNDQPLEDNDGPLRLVAPSDKRHARWIRMLHKIHILDGATLIKKAK